MPIGAHIMKKSTLICQLHFFSFRPIGFNEKEEEPNSPPLESNQTVN